jgi:CubicO group peptidase (beta-lactamase class C family)
MRTLLLIALLLRVASADPAAQIKKVLDDRMHKHHIPALAYAVVKDDQVVALDALGLRDVDAKSEATVDTVFPIGSCTKSFTAVAAAIAADDKKLSLDDSPRRYLPYFKMADAEANELVTIRDMLAHRTGLRPYGDLAAEPGVLTREEYLRATIGAKPVAKLREGFQYSNAMITAVGEIVAKVNGATWNKAIETKIFAPLGMKASTTEAERLANKPEAARGYVWDGQTWKPAPVVESLRVLAPAGAIASSARDMVPWIRMLAAGGALDGKQIVSEAALHELWRPHTQVSPNMSYGLGFVIYDWNGHHVIEHNGGSTGLSAIVSVIPDRHAAFVILANTSPTELTKIGSLTQDLWPVILGERGGPPPKPPVRGSDSKAPPPLTRKDLPTADDLVADIVRSQGGERTLKAHTSVRLHLVGRYEHQGVDVDQTVLAVDGKHVDDEVWTAAGKRIGRVRQYFDGTTGGQQTTFGQDADTVADVAAAKRDATLHPLLDVKALYDRVSVDGRGTLDGEDVIVLSLAPAGGDLVRLYVSARTHLIVRRDAGLETTTYGDFHSVDGEVVAFSRTISDSLGDKTLKVKEVKFGVPIPDATFAKLPRLAR